jgi:TetR/AcrR family transcriptional regulator, transcriptional repressor for nem operon
VGRRKEFDRDEALDRAVQLFWCKGYEATSVQDLLDEMRINRGSFYDTFGDKRSLFIAAIDRYNETFLSKLRAGLESSDSAKEAITNTVRDLASRAAADAQRRGCLVTNSVVELAPHDSEAAGRAAWCLEQMEAAFYDALVRAREQGELAERHDPVILARFLISSYQGMRVMSKIHKGQSSLGDIVNVVVAALD